MEAGGIPYELADRSPFSTSSPQIVDKTAKVRNAKFWTATAVFWVAFIFGSSTSLAGEWSERLYAFLSGSLFGQFDLQTSPDSMLHFLADKGFHVGMFFVLALLLWRAISPGPRKPGMILLMGTAVGACSELLQRFFPDRDPAVRDWLINIGGTALGLAATWALANFRRNAGQLR